jgi:hypothetical protein
MIVAALRRHLPALGLLAALLLTLFIRSFDPALTLSAGDAGMPVIRNTYLTLSTFFTGTWVAGAGMGSGGSPVNIAPGYLLAYLVPEVKYVDANALFHLLLMGIGGYFLLLDITRNRFAGFMGGLFLMLQPHVLSHLLPGHVGHFLMAGWVPLLVLFTRRAVLAGGLNWLYAGACAGAMIAAGQHDVAAFYALAVAGYGLFLLIRHWRLRASGKSWALLAAGVAAAAALALLMSYQALFSNLLAQLASQKTSTALESAQSKPMSDTEKWFWATQWSVPPVETVDMAIPGFFGWGSSDPVNQYRGRIGQTEGWSTHHQGMPNLNDVCQYLGAMLLLGCLAALILRRRDPEVWFLAAVGLIALLLAYGKFAPLYRLFYLVPGMDSLRNPIKWFYVTSLCAGILGAIGLGEASRRETAPWSRLPAALLAFLPVLIVLALGGALLALFANDPFTHWPNAEYLRLLYLEKAKIALKATDVPILDMIRSATRSLQMAALFWAGAGISVFLMLTGSRAGRMPILKIGMGLAALVMAGELIVVNSHYMPYRPWAPALQVGEYRTFLNAVKMPCRFRFLRQDGEFQRLRDATVMAGMEFTDPYASRLPDEFLLLQRRMEPADPVKFWRLCNTRYIVGPGALQDPRFTTLHTYRVGQAPIVVSELKQPLDRCVWVSSWRTAPARAAADLMLEPAFDPGRDAVVHTDDPALPAPPETADSNATCRITSFSGNRVTAETTSTQPGLVVLLSRHDPNWKAYIDGAPTAVWQADGVMQACAVPAGTHRIEWRFGIPDGVRGLRLSLLGWALAALSALAGLILLYRTSKETA